MKTIGIICEYNPFHNGHIYHINKIKEIYPNSLIILILNGYFLERGEISILTKEDKTKIALENNIDIVLELPTFWGCQSADTFASKSLEILNHFKIDELIFGSECNDITTLKNIALKQLDNNFDNNVKMYLDKGLNYPSALAKACNIDFTFNPNDLLGISYIKAILKNNYNIKATTIKRTNDYHDTKLNDKIISASNIRKKIKNKENIKKYLPKSSLKNIKIVNEDIYFKLLKAKIITDNNLNTYLDVDEGLDYRLNRMFIHILLGITKDTYDLEYIKILGFNKHGQKYIKSMNNELSIPKTIIPMSKTFNTELKASLIYDLICNTNTYMYELKNKPIIKN